MFEVTCLDSYGEVVTTLTQWDINQTLYIEDYKYDFAPIFHFCNKKSKRSLGVQSIITNGKLTVDIPNELLREPYPIIAYIYATQNDSGKTLQIIHLPVRPRVQPSEYEYVDNIRVVYLEDLIAEVEECLKKASTAENTRIENETIRIENENQRITNEVNRQKSTAAAISACNQQTEECKQATTNTLKAKELVDGLLYDIDGGNAYTNPDYMFQIDGGNCENNNG